MKCEICKVNQATFECDICPECAPNEALDYFYELELMGLDR